MAESACVTIYIRSRDLEAYLSSLTAADRNHPDETDSDMVSLPGVTCLTWYSTCRLCADDWHFENMPFYGGNDDSGGDASDTDYAGDGIDCMEMATMRGDWAIVVPAGHDVEQPVPIDEQTKQFILFYRGAKKLVDAG